MLIVFSFLQGVKKRTSPRVIAQLLDTSKGGCLICPAVYDFSGNKQLQSSMGRTQSLASFSVLSSPEPEEAMYAYI